VASVTALSRAEAALRRIVTDLRKLDRRFALVGGFAVSVHTEHRGRDLLAALEAVVHEFRDRDGA
jgi:hypothetical protein